MDVGFTLEHVVECMDPAAIELLLLMIHTHVALNIAVCV
jgi:hypothetical protein